MNKFFFIISGMLLVLSACGGRRRSHEEIAQLQLEKRMERVHNLHEQVITEYGKEIVAVNKFSSMNENQEQEKGEKDLEKVIKRAVHMQYDATVKNRSAFWQMIGGQGAYRETPYLDYKNRLAMLTDRLERSIRRIPTNLPIVKENQELIEKLACIDNHVAILFGDTLKNERNYLLASEFATNVATDLRAIRFSKLS